MGDFYLVPMKDGGKFELQASQAGGFSRKFDELSAWLACNSNFPPNLNGTQAEIPNKKAILNPQFMPSGAITEPN